MKVQTATRHQLGNGASYNPNLGTVTFALTLPAEMLEAMIEGDRRSAQPILNCLARTIETQQQPLVKSALKAVFDCIYDRTTPEERRCFPNWFDSQ